MENGKNDGDGDILGLLLGVGLRWSVLVVVDGLVSDFERRVDNKKIFLNVVRSSSSCAWVNSPASGLRLRYLSYGEV